MDTRRKSLAYIGVAVLCATGIGSWYWINRGAGTGSGRTEIPVGAILPLSGDNASFGTTARAAYGLAAEDAARLNLPKLTLRYGDSRLDKDLAMREFSRLTQVDHVLAFVETTGSGIALALAPLAEQNRVPLLSGINSSPELSAKGGRYFYRVVPSDAYSGRVLSKWAEESKLDKAVLAFNQQNGWATGFRTAILDSYRKSGILDDSAVAAVNDDTVNFSPLILRLQATRPKVWFVGLMGRQAGLFVRQAVALGIKGPFFGVDNLAQTEFASTAGESAQYARMVLPAEIQSKNLDSFVARFKEKEGHAPDIIAFKAYDAYITLASAIQRVLSQGLALSGENIKTALDRISVEGLTGRIEFDENHDLKEAAFDRFAFDASGQRRRE